jgi:nucleoside-diphosphate-sugar epimerase
MKILVVGANSFVGAGVTRALLSAGHRVAGLARSTESADAMAARGIIPLPGQIADVATKAALGDWDACIWASFLSLGAEQEAVAGLLAALKHSGRTFIFISGTAVVGIPTHDGAWDERSFAEDDDFVPPPWLAKRVATERLVLDAARTGLRTMIVRPPMVWGNGGSRQVPWVFDTAGKVGQACYLGHGLNVYSHVHVDDLADLYRRALEQGRSGAVYHAVAGEENFRSIAEAVGSALGVAARSIGFEAMAEVLGRAVTETAFALNSRSRCPRARSDLQWMPRHCGLIEDIRQGSYRARFGSGPR